MLHKYLKTAQYTVVKKKSVKIDNSYIEFLCLPAKIYMTAVYLKEDFFMWKCDKTFLSANNIWMPVMQKGENTCIGNFAIHDFEDIKVMPIMVEQNSTKQLSAALPPRGRQVAKYINRRILFYVIQSQIPYLISILCGKFHCRNKYWYVRDMIQIHFSVLTVPIRYVYFPIQDKLKSVTVFGAGLLVGTALAVIIPEGINAMYTSGGRYIYNTAI